MNSTSASLLDRLKKPGQEAGWRRFVELYSPLLYHWVRGSGLKGADAADVVQDVFVTLVEKLPQFEYNADGSFRGWLRTITQNKCRDRLRRKIAAPETQNTLDRAAPVARADAELFLEAEYRRILARRGLQLMQTEFEETTWKACWESVVSGRGAAEIGRELQISTNAVYLAKSRVLRRLREELDGILE